MNEAFSKTTDAGAASLLAAVDTIEKSVKGMLHSGFYSTAGRGFSRGPEPISYSNDKLVVLNPTEMRSQSQTNALMGIVVLFPFTVNF